MPTDETFEERMRDVNRIVENLRATYPDAKRFSVSIKFEWVETEFYTDGAELCPVVNINIER